MQSNYSHLRNFLKLRVMHAMNLYGALEDTKVTLTPKELGTALKVKSENVSRMFSNNIKKDTPYFIRLKPKGETSHEYRYQLSEEGRKWLIRYMRRFLSGHDLNCRRLERTELQHYNGHIATKDEAIEALNKHLSVDFMLNYVKYKNQQIQATISNGEPY